MAPNQNPGKSQNTRENDDLKAIAQDTVDILPEVLKERGMTEAAEKVQKFTFRSCLRLDPNHCPSLERPAKIKVVNKDTLNAAIILQEQVQERGPHQRPLIVNFANERLAGGGWLKGAIAQEEAICYRSSLSLSLKNGDYPLKKDEALYSPLVLVIREDMSSGHSLYPFDDTKRPLPEVSAVTIAALRKPEWREFPVKWNYDGNSGTGSQPRKKSVFRYDEDRDITKRKMRLILRIAAHKRHTKLVLGALGCGIYANPPEDIAHCWLEVLREDEFSGNWWQEVWFAVYDPKRSGNFDTFERVLSGQMV